MPIKEWTIHTTPRANETARMTTDELRSNFLIENCFNRDRVTFKFTDLDRMAVAGLEPGTSPVELQNDPETGRGSFFERREMGIINTGGGAGVIVVDGKKYDMAPRDCLYIGMGTKTVTFASSDASKPAKYFMVSCPAHANYPTTHASTKDANKLSLGTQATANVRNLYQYIHEKGIKSCQLVMGFTELAEGSVWNTMPSHTHSRRTEIYHYFDMNGVVVHLMGRPDQTRNLMVHEGNTILSPAWSIHSGVGTANYRFIWVMSGENQAFDDMDKFEAKELR